MAPAIPAPTARIRARPTPTRAATSRAARASPGVCEGAWCSCDHRVLVHGGAYLRAMAAEGLAVAGGGGARLADVDADVPHNAPAVHHGDAVGQVNGFCDVV